MALVTRFVNTGSTAGGDGTTNATSGDNRAYASLNEWEAAEQTDLVTDTDTHLVHCEGSVADTTAVTITGWTTGASNDITVQVDSDVRHGRTFDTGSYRLSVVDGDNIYFVAEDYVSTIGLQFEVTGKTAAGSVILTLLQGAANALSFSYCIVRGDDNDSFELVLFEGGDADSNITIYNSLFLDTGDQIASLAIGEAGDFTLYNVTIANCNRGIRGTGTWVETNVLIEVSAGGQEGWFNDASHTRTTCASSDATANEQGGTGNRDSQSFTFVNAAGSDYGLASGDTAAIGLGTDDPGSGLFSDDVEGDTRVSTWDIGFDEFVASGTTHDATATVAMVTTTVAAATESTNVTATVAMVTTTVAAATESTDATATVSMVTTTVAAATESTNATATVAMVTTTVAAATESTNATATVAMVTTTVAAATESTNATATVAIVTTTAATASMTSNSIAAVAWVTTTVASLGSFDDDIVAFTVGIQQLDSGIFTIQQLNANTVGVAQVKPFTVGV